MAGLERDPGALGQTITGRMKQITGILFIFLVFFLNAFVYAEDQRFPFKDPEQAEQFRKLTKELRCLVCQNQSLADSDAPLAHDLRKKVFLMMKEGKTSDEIIQELVARYGEFVLYRPRLSKQTWLLWFAPVIVFIIGVFVITYLVRRRSGTSDIGERELETAHKLLEEEE